MRVYPLCPSQTVSFHLRTYVAAIHARRSCRLRIERGYLGEELVCEWTEQREEEIPLFVEILRCKNEQGARQDMVRRFWEYHLMRNAGMTDVASIRKGAYFLASLFYLSQGLPFELELRLEEWLTGDICEGWQDARRQDHRLRKATEWRPNPPLLTYQQSN